MKERLSEAPQRGEPELSEPVLDPAPEVIDDTKSSPLTALNAFNRQLASVNAALTELQVASERSETTTLMLARINAEGCGSFISGLDGSKNDHLTSLSRGRRGGSGLGTTLSV